MHERAGGAYAREMRSIAAMLVVFREFDPQGHTPIQMAHIFVLIALNQGCSATDVERAAGVSQSAVSRNVLMLSDGIEGEAPGLGLVVRRHDPNDARRRRLYLSRRGLGVARRLLSIFLNVPESALTEAVG